MKTYIEDEEQHSDTEITLGTKSILGIFFGLALICGVFFGFGYSVGRGNTAKTAAEPLPQATEPSADDTRPSSLVKTLVESSHQSASDNSAANQSSDSDDQTPSPRAATPAISRSKPAPGAPIVSATDTAQSTSPPITSPAQAMPPATPASLPVQGSGSPSDPIMVQIAAVSHREDADVLVSALKKLGYNASVRSVTTDNLLRVQVGPFATRDEAKNVRARLLNDGYNAIVK